MVAVSGRLVFKENIALAVDLNRVTGIKLCYCYLLISIISVYYFLFTCVGHGVVILMLKRGMWCLSHLIEFLIPFRKFTETFSQACTRLEAEVTLQCTGIRIGHGNIARLHGNQLLVRLKVIICW